MLSQHRIRNLEEPSLSDDHFITRRFKSSDKSTRSYSDTKNRLPYGTRTRNVSPPQCQRPSTRPQDRGRTHRGVTEPRLSLNEVRPRVTVVIYILQAVHAVLQFLYELLMVLYRKFCTVPRHHPHIPPIPTASSTSCLTTASRYSTYSTYTSSRQTTPRPALPTNVSISAQILWNYMKLDQDLKKSDIVLIFGNFDMRTCQHACQLWVDGLAEYIMYTSVVDSRKHRLKQAQVFDALAESMNVPLECVLLETDSKNIIECITNSHKMLKRLGLKIKSIILVHLPFMERLLLLTFLQAWPVKGTNVIVTSPPITLINFPNPVVGCMEQIIQDIAEAVEFVLRYDPASRNTLPDDVREAFHTLRPQNAEEILAIRNKYISKSESRTISIDQTSIGTVELTPQTATSRSKKSGTSFVSQHTNKTRAKAKMQIKTVQLSGSNNAQQTNTRSIRTQFSQHMHR